MSIGSTTYDFAIVLFPESPEAGIPEPEVGAVSALCGSWLLIIPVAEIIGGMVLSVLCFFLLSSGSVSCVVDWPAPVGFDFTSFWGVVGNFVIEALLAFFLNTATAFFHISAL